MLNKINPPIFIIGISRSGSKFYQQLLNSNSEICIAPEMNFYFPLKKDLRDVILKNIHLGSAKIVEEIYKSPLKSTLKDIISNYDEVELINQIQKNGECNVENIFKSILELYSKSKGRKIYGAKFPIHNSKLYFLNKNFPSAKIIFIIRNPFDIAYSDLTKKIHRIKNKKSSFLTNNIFLLKLIFPFYIAFEWTQMLRNYKRYKEKFGVENSVLLKYEMINSKPNIIVDKIAKLLDVPTSKFDLNKIERVDSSKNNIIFSEIPRFYIKYQNFILKILLNNRLREYNYKI